MKVKEVAMVVALALLSAFFVGLLVDALYVAPKYEDFCKAADRPYYELKPYPAAYPQECSLYNLTTQEQHLINECFDAKGMPDYNLDEKGCQTSFKECNYCQRDFDQALQKYNRNVFYIVTPLGLLAIIFGLFIGLEVVGSGMMFGGILLMAYGTMRYFSNMSKIMRVVVIGVELLLLIIISIKKLRK
ncbi:MAG TPA: hypothetical protein VJH37_00205 [Candidatus Nanoarchaeia archaeon]|nr:hypothetical protein [Candidatus Nanoarchaeia archaeon]